MKKAGEITRDKGRRNRGGKISREELTK